MHFLYIIFSEKLSRFYIGETHDFEKRLDLHNSNSYEKAFTKSADDWQIKLLKQTQNKEEALYLEKFIKKMKSKYL